VCNLRSFKKKLINEVEALNIDLCAVNNAQTNNVEQKNKNHNINLSISNLSTVTRTQNLSAHAVWGSFIGLLRKENLMTLHTACGDIRDVELKDFVLEVKLYDEYLYKILTKEQNFEKIVFYLKQIDDRISIQFKLIKKSTNYGLENLNKLKAFFGSELEEN